MRLRFLIPAALIAIGWLATATAQDPKPVRVTVDNFARAETHTYFAKFVGHGAFGKFIHRRELAPIDKQAVIRMNRDTLYSEAVFDLDTSPVTVTLPDAGKRFMSLQVINEDHYTSEVIYKPGAHTCTKAKVGTRYVMLLIRIFVSGEPADMKAAHALQDAIKVEQKEMGRFVVPRWDLESLTKVRDALKALSAASGDLDSARMFGRKDEVDPVHHLIGSAVAWGGSPKRDAYYRGFVPKDNDGKTVYRLTLKDVPVDGFWSVSVYNKDGFFEKNAKNAYTLNNVTAKPNADGSFTIQFGGCEGDAPNCLPITPGWNYLVRMFRPRKEILAGIWKIPEAQPVK
ncbi:MAG: DUF1254 domain-containing protein [Planctomycetia bacterium]|nr:DUF1254 domain-containing protein [Planctomycetia bacterium]